MKHADVNVIFNFDEWKQHINSIEAVLTFGTAELYFPEFLQNHTWFMTAPVAIHDGRTLTAKSLKFNITAQSPESDEYVDIKLKATIESMIS